MKFKVSEYYASNGIVNGIGAWIWSSDNAYTINEKILYDKIIDQKLKNLKMNDDSRRISNNGKTLCTFNVVSGDKEAAKAELIKAMYSIFPGSTAV